MTAAVVFASTRSGLVALVVVTFFVLLNAGRSGR